MDSDSKLALKLYKELNRDIMSPNPAKKRKATNAEDESIVDPQWEITDPNPDIHSLFLVFDKKYFWGTLDSVEVKWSPRMYSCAGICTYKGKLGGCVIALSLPLLKLRPRKDLVETLLHEMIHAYLFVADRNRDRGEHGPKFHEHMYRINKEAGTKITVYHTFHDEVKHYKQHWWRCNGPCQNEKPFFGLVKRSMNRAPGPNDFWFAEHKARCGGEFTKIKEPEGFKSRKRGPAKPVETPKNKGTNNSLDKYFPGIKSSTPTGVESKKGLYKEVNQPTKKGSNSKKDTLKRDSKLTTNSNMMGIKNNSGSVVKTLSNNNTSAKIDNYKKISNVHGFTNLSKPGSLTSHSSGHSSSKKVEDLRGTGLKSNMGGTLLLNPKSSSTGSNGAFPKKDENIAKSIATNVIIPFTGSGHVLGGNSLDKSKSKLLNLYGNNSSPGFGNLPSSVCSTKNRTNEVSFTSDTGSNLIVHCPVCNQSMNESLVYDHLESCSNLESVFESTSSVRDEEIDLDEDLVKPNEILPIGLVQCPVCNQSMNESLINDHLEGCLNLEQKGNTAGCSSDPDVVILEDTDESQESHFVKCPVCGETSSQQEINNHLDNCLN